MDTAIMDALKQLIQEDKIDELASYFADHSNLPGKMANLSLASSAQAIFRNSVPQLGFEKLFDLSKSFARHDHEFVRLIAGRVFGAIGQDHYRESLSELKLLADDNSWRVREGAAEGIGELLCRHFDQVLRELQSWVSSGIPNLQRAVVVGMVSMVSYDQEMMVERTLDMLDTIESVLDISDQYVQKGVSFALNILGWKNPRVVLERMNMWIEGGQFRIRPTGLVNMVNSLNSRFGQQNAGSALILLDRIERKVSGAPGITGVFDPKRTRQLESLIQKVKVKLKR